MNDERNKIPSSILKGSKLAAKSFKKASKETQAGPSQPENGTRLFRKRGVKATTKFPSDFLVYVNKTGRPFLEFNEKGIPVHEISFDEKLNVIQSGFLKEQILELKERYGINLEDMAKILNIAGRSIQNKPHGFKFTGNVAEKVLGLSDIYSYGIEVFEERDKFKKWLETPNPSLGNKLPFELFLTQLGMQQVRQELARIDHGIY